METHVGDIAHRVVNYSRLMRHRGTKRGRDRFGADFGLSARGPGCESAGTGSFQPGKHFASPEVLLRTLMLHLTQGCSLGSVREDRGNR